MKTLAFMLLFIVVLPIGVPLIGYKIENALDAHYVKTHDCKVIRYSTPSPVIWFGITWRIGGTVRYVCSNDASVNVDE